MNVPGRGAGVLSRACALLLLPVTAFAADLTPAGLRLRLDAGAPPALLDVRTPEEYAEGHIPGAVNIPLDELEQRLAEVPAAPDGELVVYCVSGLRARTAMETLSGRGYTRLLGLEGGLPGWEALAPAAGPGAENPGRMRGLDDPAPAGTPAEPAP
jgi:phage shock protein E